MNENALMGRLADMERRIAELEKGCLHAVKKRLTAIEQEGTTPNIAELQAIVRVVCAAYGIEPTSIYPQGRRHPQLEARQMVMNIAICFGFSATQIGRLFRRDHTTVLHADFVTNQRRLANPEFAAKYAAIYAEVKNERA